MSKNIPARSNLDFGEYEISKTSVSHAWGNISDNIFRDFLNKLVELGEQKNGTNLDEIFEVMIEALDYYRHEHLFLILISEYSAALFKLRVYAREYNFNLDFDYILRCAVHSNFVELCKLLLKKGTCAKKLILGKYEKSDDIIKLLIEYSPDIFTADHNKYFFKICLFKNSIDVLKLMITKKLVNKRIINDALITSIISKRLDLVEMFVTLCDADINYDNNLLMRTIMTQDINIIKYILNKNVAIDKNIGLTNKQNEIYNLLSESDLDKNMLLKLLLDKYFNFGRTNGEIY